MNRFRKLLFPLAIVYGWIVTARNCLYDKQWFGFKSVSYKKPIICVGNLSVGGTGKSPMIEFLVTLLENKHDLAVLSRGTVYFVREGVLEYTGSVSWGGLDKIVVR